MSLFHKHEWVKIILLITIASLLLCGCDKHEWVKIKETYAEPCEITSTKGFTKSIRYVGLFQGLTTIIWECSICHKIRREEMLGK